MAGQRIQLGDTVAFIDYHDAEGSAVVGNREYRWDFHEYCGPLFLRKDGEPLAVQPREKHPIWEKFNSWLQQYQSKRAKTPQSEIIKIDVT